VFPTPSCTPELHSKTWSELVEVVAAPLYTESWLLIATPSSSLRLCGFKVPRSPEMAKKKKPTNCLIGMQNSTLSGQLGVS